MDHRRFSPAAARNTAPILDALGPRLARTRGAALEIASGSGQHILALAQAAPHLTWTPSDPDLEARRSVSAWAAEARGEGARAGASPRLGNLRPPVEIDAASPDWSADWPDAPTALALILSANMVHIAPWDAAEGLFAGAGRWLEPGGALILYGPFSEDGTHSAASNAAFDSDLRRMDPRFGVRDLRDLDALGRAAGLRRVETVALPANNHIVIYERDA